MSKFFIDLYDGGNLTADKHGNRFKSFADARLAAIKLVRELCDYELPDGEHRSFAAVVRSEAGEGLYRAGLAFEGTRMGSEAPRLKQPQS